MRQFGPTCCGLFLAFVVASVASAQQEHTVRFTDVTQSAGIQFTHYKGNKGISINLEEFGPGVCVADFDDDGWPDIYFVNTRERYGRDVHVRNALYRNNRDGTFTDVTDKAGVSGTGFGLGCVWGDYDNDGFPDLFVTQFGKNVLYHNNGDGTFTDVTDKAGVGGLEIGLFHSGGTFVDYDRDGKLDLYVNSYVTMDPDKQRYCTLSGVTSSCPPVSYKGSPNALYHNNGDGSFTNVTKKSKILELESKGLAVGAADFDNDGWPDIFVANDGIRAFLFHNLRNGTFEEVAGAVGIAYNQFGQTMAAMCISLGDYKNDGFLDLYISDFQGSSDHLWHNEGKGYFTETSDAAGITIPTRNVLSFGGGFFDYDNDGWVDIFIANGHVYPEIEQVSPTTQYKQHNTLFHNEHNGKFTDASEESGIGAVAPRAGRGAAFLDYDNDGFVDVIVANNGDPPTLVHNSGSGGNHFVNFKLVGTKAIAMQWGRGSGWLREEFHRFARSPAEEAIFPRATSAPTSASDRQRKSTWSRSPGPAERNKPSRKFPSTSSGRSSKAVGNLRHSQSNRRNSWGQKLVRASGDRGDQEDAVAVF